MERVDADLVPFAQNNPSGYRFAFGTDTATDNINANYNDNIKKGWGTKPNEFPEVEDFNAFAYTSGYLTAYLYQMGIAEWNNKQKYRQNSRVIGSDGKIYKAKTGTDLSPNVNNNPTSGTTNWEIDNQFDINSLTAKTTPIDSDNLAIQETGGLLKKLTWANIKATLKTYFDTLYVSLTENQTITGLKTFTDSLIVKGANSFTGYRISSTYSAGESVGYIDSTNSSAIADSNIFFKHQIDGSSSITFATTPAGSKAVDRRVDRVSINSYGELIVGQNALNSGFMVHTPEDISYSSFAHKAGVASGSWFQNFMYNGTTIGTITQNGTTAVVYNTTSDYRLKENIRPADCAKFMDIKFVDYERIDGRHECGVIAHELQEIYPDLVTGDKDATEIRKIEVTPFIAEVVSDDGKVIKEAIEATYRDEEFPVYQQVNYMGLIARIGTVVQQQQKLINELTEKIEILEGK